MSTFDIIKQVVIIVSFLGTRKENVHKTQTQCQNRKTILLFSTENGIPLVLGRYLITLFQTDINQS